MKDTNDETGRALRAIEPRIDGLPETAASSADGLLALVEADARDAAGGAEHAPPAPAPNRSRRRLLRTAFVVPAAAAAVLGAAVLAPGGADRLPLFGPGEARALEITEDDHYIIAEIVDPTADTAEYSEELAEYGVDVELNLVPVMPGEGGFELLSVSWHSGPPEGRGVRLAPGAECGAPDSCPMVLKVPKDYRDTVRIDVSREAAPGEYWDGSSPVEDASAIGVIDTGALVGRPVAEVRERLAGAGFEVEAFNRLAPEPERGEGRPRTELEPDQVPGGLLVAAVFYRPFSGSVELVLTDEPDDPFMGGGGQVIDQGETGG
ncbi:hypothetical protein [Nocardiopsis potens]|uniref:hypothetical protein n=1 Tax=Nocardiopsis potens TaxID=1246458 RepID=UPI00034D416B|nr:hypothetical protein [Nocardiopsis potens]